MRRFEPNGTCACCGKVGPVWRTRPSKPVFADEPGMTPREVDTTEPDWCDRCQYAQACWDARQRQIRTPGAG